MEHSETEAVRHTAHTYHKAEFIFALAAFAVALFLLSQSGSQVTWSSSKALVNQPGFWPVMAIVGMVIFGTGELFVSVRRFRHEAEGAIPTELFHWLRAIEYAAWFLIYVTIVPIVGYLPTTIVFCVLLTWRLGYRTRNQLLAGALTGLAVVVVFKSFLSVKIPGGQSYEYLPDGLRNFMILYF
ncbi:MAG: tripartite tricarboxylate transporter TctB family protein [Rhizobiaceae bacterium]